MRLNNRTLALFALIQANAAQEKPSPGHDSVVKTEEISSAPQDMEPMSLITGVPAPSFVQESGSIAQSNTKKGDESGSANRPTTTSSFHNPSSPLASAGATAGIETVDFVRISFINEPRKRAVVTVTESTSVLDAPLDPTPVFHYNFCRGCQASFVTTPVPGYTERADSRNFNSCLVSPVNATSPARLRPSGKPSRSIRPPRPSSKINTFKTIDPLKTPAGPVTDPAATGPPGFTTTIYVTATIVNQIEVISICSTNGDITTIIEQPATCETYTTCVTIPASLCNTFVSTQDNGELTTWTTPVETWTQILATTITSTAQADNTADGAAPVQTVVSAGYSSVQTNTAEAASEPQVTSNAGAQGVSPTTSTPGQTTHVTAGADRFGASLFVLVISLLACTLV